ncbi:DUF4178 domain-containing protein [Flaviaesturariibacter amylovorans]|uniref:DUF4178 domain-containing protein n=1 Tax=Flaviaesturariibacter amylovorans TaxID=1084520 RepID=A0ABP8GYR9_9BACT
MGRKLHTCPGCGAMLPYAAEGVNLKVCTCGAVVEHKEDGTLATRGYYRIDAPFELLQPGTQGQWQGRPFTVLGRIRAFFPGTAYNYWTILFDDGELSWLGEGYGLYSVLRSTTIERRFTPDDLDALKIGARRDLFKETPYLLVGKGQCRQWEVEGELFLPPRSERFREFSFADPGGRHFVIFEFTRNHTVTFEEFPASFDSFGFTNTRPEPEGAGIKDFSCTKCNRPVRIRNFPYAQSGHCDHCGHHLALSDSGNTFVANGRNETDPTPVIPVGSSGTLFGINYEVVGYSRKVEENRYRSQWREYVLWNRFEGYAFLSEFDGHWLYLRERIDGPVLLKPKAQSFEVDNEPFQLFNRYNFSVDHAEGSFPGHFFDVGMTEVSEYISPPELWSVEFDQRGSVTWFHGQHVPKKEVGAAFGITDSLPWQKGVGAVEPLFYIDGYKLIGATVVGLLLLLIVHWSIGTTLQERLLLSETLYFTGSDTVTAVGPEWKLEKGSSNLEFRIHAPVDNTWAAVEASLINKSTGKEYGLEKGVEYYSGYSDGEHWSEGDRSEEAYLTAIPAGTYFLQLRALREATYNPASHVSVEVRYDVPATRNVVIPFLLLLIWPIVQYIRVNTNEKKRWANSPFTPYEHEA